MGGIPRHGCRTSGLHDDGVSHVDHVCGTVASTIVQTDATQKSRIVESGYVVDPERRIPLEKDMYISCYWVPCVSREVSPCVISRKRTVLKNRTIEWAIAGRSERKLNDLKERLVKELSMQIERVVVDTGVPSTLPVSWRKPVRSPRRRETLREVGYALRADQRGGSRVKTMMERWNETARKTGAILIPFCGHDSVPWGSGCVHHASAAEDGMRRRRSTRGFVLG